MIWIATQTLQVPSYRLVCNKCLCQCRVRLPRRCSCGAPKPRGRVARWRPSPRAAVSVAGGAGLRTVGHTRARRGGRVGRHSHGDRLSDQNLGVRARRGCGGQTAPAPLLWNRHLSPTPRRCAWALLFLPEVRFTLHSAGRNHLTTLALYETRNRLSRVLCQSTAWSKPTGDPFLSISVNMLTKPGTRKQNSNGSTGNLRSLRTLSVLVTRSLFAGDNAYACRSAGAR